MEKLKLAAGMTGEQKRYAVEAALLLGFQTETATFPVITADGEIPVPENMEELKALWKKSTGGTPEEYESASKHTGPIFDLDFRKEKGLETMLQKGDFLKDENQDLLPDVLDVKIVLPEDADDAMLVAACNLAWRFGMETTGYKGTITADAAYTGNRLVLEKAEQTELVREKEGESVKVSLRGDGEELIAFTSRLCMEFPQINGQRSWKDLLMDMVDDFVLRGADGQLAALKAMQKEQTGEYEVYGSPLWNDTQKKEAGDAKVYNYKSGQKMYEKVYELPWEVEVFEKLLEEKVYPQIGKGSKVKITGAVSENIKVRHKIKEKIEDRIQMLGAKPEDTSVICAYKQGYSWIVEEMLPVMKEAQADQVEIYFKPFLPEGQTDWLDENGATPSYHNLNADTPDKWYDLPIRYLQELYPVEDILVKELGIERDKVIFKAYEGEEDITYLCKGIKDEKVCCEDTYKAVWSERPYMDEYPQMGKVHPATGYVKAEIDGQEVFYQTVRTDMEEIWDVYQKEVLPDCRRYIEKKTGGKISADLQPFFHELRLDVTASEPDYATGSREDLISSLDALHEDMYFVGSDYFKNYGVKKADVMLDAPGLILPVIHEKEGRPVFKVTLTEPLKEEACIVKDGKAVLLQRKREEADAWIRAISWENDNFTFHIRTNGVQSNVLHTYSTLWSKGVLAECESVVAGTKLLFESEQGEIQYAALTPEREEKPKTKRIEEIDLHEHELIGYDTYREIIEELKQVPGIEVFRTAVSYTGRELYAVWIKPEYEGYLSMTKRISRIPGEMINARHHANEVSSTNAAFILIKKLLTEDVYKDLPDKLNLVIVPMENVDGAAIHYELQKEHPNWKFHVARFNSLGKEFYYEHFQQDTIHSEAMGLTRIYDRYVPDMIVDNHGVPSHEWEQQFSGYTSPSYKGFWLPRSLLYGYFWYVTNPEYKDNYPVNKVMEDVIADKIAEYPEMRELNREWSAQFEKYAHAWMPKLFPANYYKEMINYWIPFAADPNHRYPSIRFPWITTVAYTSEVADETAQGEYLNLCARAHVAHDEATIRMLMEAVHVMECHLEEQDGQILTSYIRQRPMIVKVTGKNK